LPLVPDQPVDFGVTHFCLVCGKCAKHCPGQAILCGDRTTKPNNVSNAKGELKWPINAEKCLAFWSRNEGSCMNCIRVCPFNKPKGMLHDFVRFIINHFPWLDRLMLKGDTFARYDKQKKPQFWSD
jgi:epoxyqueuosine reductase